MEVITVKHSFNAGDGITIMAGLKKLYEDTGKKIKFMQRLNLPAYYYDGQVSTTTDNSGNSVCMNESLFKKFKPLIESQKYIESCDIWEGQPVDYDFDLTRDSKSIPMPASTIHSWYTSIFPEMQSDLSKPWITVEGKVNESAIIVNRTRRYTNPYITYYFLNKYSDKVWFSGTDDEHKSFCAEWKLDIPKIMDNDFYELAVIIKKSRFGIYNQSMNFHIADAIKSKRILELCAVFPNTFVNGSDGYQFYRQVALEYYFEKLINE